MRAALLDSPIGVYKPKSIVNDYGEELLTYDLEYSTRARVLNSSGNRTYENNEIYFDYRKTFHIRIYHKIDETYRIKYNDKFYRILSIELNKQQQNKVIITELVNE